MISRRLLAAITVAGALTAGAAEAQDGPEQKEVSLAVGGKTLLYYLPLTLAEQLGYFEDEGLEVTISDFAGGSKSLQALMGGSADVVTGAYDHTIQMQAKGQPITATVVLGRFPGIVLGVAESKAAEYQGPESLKGWNVGVTAPGSSTNFMVNYLLSRHGLQPSDVSFIGVGGGPSAVAAVRRGEVDAIANLDPVITQLETAGAIEVVADTRTQAGSEQVYGGGYPAAVLYTKPEFVEENPKTVQALVNAFVRTLDWLQKASSEEVAGKVPEAYFLGDRAAYTASLEHSKPMYSPTGELDMAAAENARKVLAAFDENVKQADIDLAKTWDGRFVEEARAKLGN
jgi:NitT/TauT family transport system substrate-binding protein